MSEENNIDINHFKLCLKEYLKLDDEIKTIQTVLRNKKIKYENLEETLLLFLQKNKINQVQLEGEYQGKELISQKLTKTKNVSSNGILDIIKQKCCQNNELFQSIMDEINKHKEINEIERIKISKPNIKKKKSIINNNNNETNHLLMNTVTEIDNN